jgi:hypothetical protein
MIPSQNTALFRLGCTMFGITPVVLAFWAVGAYLNQWDVVDTARHSAVCVMLILAASITAPLLMRYPWEDRKKGFVFYWFSIATLFNFTWQVPLILFRSNITQAEVTHPNLLKFIAWWGYGFADSHYGKVDRWMISEEIWWFLAILISIRGLMLVRQQQELRGFLLLGIAGALQSYNASLYIVYDVVTGLRNVPDGSIASQLLYWGFNPLWAGAALLASVFSFGFVLTQAEPSARRQRT